MNVIKSKLNHKGLILNQLQVNCEFCLTEMMEGVKQMKNGRKQHHYLPLLRTPTCLFVFCLFCCIPLHHPLSPLVIMHLPFYSPHCLFPAAVSRRTHPHSCRRTQTRILRNKLPTGSTVNPHRVHIFSCPPNIAPAWLNEHLNQFTFM